jgi:hypothetical protein
MVAHMLQSHKQFNTRKPLSCMNEKKCGGEKVIPEKHIWAKNNIAV